MNNTKFTPGPWQYIVKPANQNVVWIEGWSEVIDNNCQLATIDLSRSIDLQTEELANAALMTAAPEMYEALEKIGEMMKNLMAKGNINWGATFGIDFGLMNEALLKQARAVAKARGEK